jgi:hypothetical protein
MPKTLASVMPAVIPASAGLGSPQPLLSPGPMMPIAPGPAIAPKPAPFPQSRASHSFLDKENLAIFAALAASRSMDMVSTWQFRRHGLHEGQLSDSFVDNKPLFVSYSGSLVAGQVATSYFFHRMGWHKLERITAMVHTGVVAEAVVHNYRIGKAH